MLIPADLEQEKILATGAYGTNIVAIRGNYDAVNRLCTEIAGERPWAFVNVNLRPYYAEGSKTLAFETAEQLGWRAAGPRGRADRLGLAVHEGRARLPGVHRRRACSAASCPPSTAPRRSAARRSRPRSRPARDVCRRSSRTRSPSRWRSATRPTAPTRSSWRARPAAAIDSVTDDEIRAGIRLLAETTGIFTETAGGVTTAVLAKLAERGDIGRDERVVAYITGDGLKTLDTVRGTFEVTEIAPSIDEFDAAFAPAGGGGLMAVTVKLPTQLRDAAGGAAAASVEGGTVGEALEALYAEHGELRGRLSDDGGGLRRFVNVYIGGEDIRFLDGLDTPVSDGDELTILPAVAGG